MKIAEISSINNSSPHIQPKKKNPSFKSLGTTILGASGALMQGIENKGYFLSFLIQDGLGMTLPRVITGFHRDKEITGEYNVKEGLEVLGREGMTGPFMMSVAPLMLWLGGKYCKSAGTNTRLIKHIGKNFKSMLESPEFSQSVKADKEAFKKEFYKFNITKFYRDSVPGDKEADKTIAYILKEFENFDSTDKKLSEKAYKNILTTINDRMVASSSNLDEICRLSINQDGATKSYAAGDVLKAIRAFGQDAIGNNPNSSEIDTVAAENIKNNFASKRLLFNTASIGGTLAGLSVLPKIYAFSSVAPGAEHFIQDGSEDAADKTEGGSNPTFKGKGINSENIFSKLGRFITKKVPEWAQREFEYSGINFTPTLMACLSLFGLLLPRGMRAYNRAYIDENGKRDMSEIHEILFRDTISSLAVVYTVPILTKLLVNSYENKRGFILTNRASMEKSWWKKALDVINPYSDLKVLTNTELEALYGNIDSKSKMLNFANYIDKKGGDLEKILSKSRTADVLFNSNTVTLDSLKNKSKSEKNKEIISTIEKLKDNSETKELIIKLMKDNGKIKQSSITRIARGLNSIPGVIVTVLISPIILGCFIPMLTYANTRKAHAKQLAAKEAAKNQPVNK